MNLKHWQICEAPICMDFSCYVDQPNWKKEVLWYPGELVCKLAPYNHVQKIQNRINKLFDKKLLKFPERYFTYEMLSRKKVIKPGILGGNPDVMTWEKPPQNSGEQKKRLLSGMSKKTNSKSYMTSASA